MCFQTAQLPLIHISIILGNSRECFSVSNSTISNWASCFPETTNLNQEEQQPGCSLINSVRMRLFRKCLRIRNLRFQNSVLRNSVEIRVVLACCGLLPCWHFAHHSRMSFLCWRRKLYFWNANAHIFTLYSGADSASAQSNDVQQCYHTQ